MIIEPNKRLTELNELIEAYEAKIRDLNNERNKIIFEEQRKEKEHE